MADLLAEFKRECDRLASLEGDAFDLGSSRQEFMETAFVNVVKPLAEERDRLASRLERAEQAERRHGSRREGCVMDDEKIDLCLRYQRERDDWRRCAEKAERERDAWVESARHFADGQEFYQGIVRQIGQLFGEAARTSDDGSVQDDVLALKVPELVEALVAHVGACKPVVQAYANTCFFDKGKESVKELANQLDRQAPKTSLARLKAQWQAEIVRKVADEYQDYPSGYMYMMDLANDIERGVQ